MVCELLARRVAELSARLPASEPEPQRKDIVQSCVEHTLSVCGRAIACIDSKLRDAFSDDAPLAAVEPAPRDEENMRGEQMGHWTVPRMDVGALLAGIPSLGFAPTGMMPHDWYVGMPPTGAPTPEDIADAKLYPYVLLGSEPWGILNALDVGDRTVFRLYWLKYDKPDEATAARWQATMQTALETALDSVGLTLTPEPAPAPAERGPSAETRRRAEMFRSIKAEDSKRSYAKVAEIATRAAKARAGQGETPPKYTRDNVIYAYKKMGWDWERADQIR
jgi:hypothetical protein